MRRRHRTHALVYWFYGEVRPTERRAKEWLVDIAEFELDALVDRPRIDNVALAEIDDGVPTWAVSGRVRVKSGGYWRHG